MSDKRTCGECEHYPSINLVIADCNVPVPIWFGVYDKRTVLRDGDATHCETFKPKIKVGE